MLGQKSDKCFGAIVNYTTLKERLSRGKSQRNFGTIRNRTIMVLFTHKNN